MEVFTAPALGEAPDPGGVAVHRLDPLFAFGNAPMIPALARVEGFDVVHIHYPFIFGSDLTLLGRVRRSRRRQALLVHYKNRLVGDGARGAMFEAYEHTVAPALIRAADRVCVLSADHADSVGYLRRARMRDPGKLIEMPNGVDAETFSPGSDEGLRASLQIPESAVVTAFVATLDRAHHFKRLDIAIEGLAGAPAATGICWSPAAASCWRTFARPRRARGWASACTSWGRCLIPSCHGFCAPPTSSC